MMHIPNNFYIKCDKCGNVTLIEADGLDYETSVYDRPMGEILIYQSDDGLTNIDVKIQDKMVCLTQQQMADLF